MDVEIIENRNEMMKKMTIHINLKIPIATALNL